MKFLKEMFSKIDSKNISGLTDELKTLYINNIFQNKPQNIIILTSTLYEATKYFNYLKTYIDDVFLFPMDEFLTSVAIAESPDLKVKRLEALNNLSTGKPQIVVTNLTGFLKFVPNKKALEKLKVDLKKSSTINRENLEKIINKFGYNKTSIVTSSGEYSIRGFIIDIFPFDEEYPIRIELFGNTIENIKTFDVESQRSIKEIEEITILPYSEIIEKEKSSLFDLMNKPLVIKIDPEIINKSNELLLAQMMDYKEEKNIDPNFKFMYDLSEMNIPQIINLSSFNQKVNALERKVFPFIFCSFCYPASSHILQLSYQNLPILPGLFVASPVSQNPAHKYQVQRSYQKNCQRDTNRL